jgi:hypothetical protein
MKNTLLASLLAVSSLSASAHSNQSCEYGLDYNLQINPKSIQFTHPDRETVEFAGNTLVVGGVSLQLSQQQKALTEQFASKTRKVVPKIAEVAVEGAEIGLTAATLAVNALFGEDPQVHQDLIVPIKKISDKIKANINDEMINSKVIEESFDQELEQEIENLVAKALSKYSGKILGQVLSSVFSGDREQMKDFEFRMENLEYDIERYVESQASALETKAEVICEEIKILSDIDQKLTKASGYPAAGLITLGNDHSSKLSRIKINF